MSFLPFSDLCDYAEKWRGFAYSQFVLLGQFYRWKLYCQMGKQDHVLHSYCLWPCDLSGALQILVEKRLVESTLGFRNEHLAGEERNRIQCIFAIIKSQNISDF